MALAGGTGSGKSSLFNRLTRLSFADVGVKRPTTARVTACSWSAGADALLDWIGVDRERRIVQSGELDGSVHGDLSGLVLLDLPDHDSVEPAHREVVDRVLPMVDLLVWVVDPQKYADDALHSGYLREQVGSESSMVVVLNQVDTVPAGQRENLEEDLARLLRDDGLEGVWVQGVSARTGEGVDRVYDLLEEVCARRSVAAGRAAAELDAAARALLEQTPADVPWHTEAAVERELGALVEATGLDAVARQVGAAVRNGYGMPEFPPPDRDAIALSRSRWLTRAGASLRPGWQRALAESVASADQLRTAVAGALRSISLDTRGPASARALQRAGWLAVGVAAVLAVLGVLAVTGVLDLADPWPVVLLVSAVVVGVGGVALFVARVAMRRSLARRRERAVASAGRAALEQVLTDGLGTPTQRLLVDHRRVRELAASARDLPHGRPLTGSRRLPTADEVGASSTGRAAGGARESAPA
ncbi:GTP-binding protein EngB required for normal cell division [Isoptericola variabilis J7]|uniref:GTPase n=1 Tax=Isoptericola variabilis TaxID=139208 RepID=UPI0011ABAB56|nr:GTPase [Isoptericola variabilis]TWH34138.1 GTP-binding protein EngB required for normal cell division [Isoptericola variabilis J7]